MKKALPEAFQPRLGLSSIFLTGESETSKLPDDSRLQPIDVAVDAHLRAILRAETFESLILEAVRPKVFDRAVLGPSRFHLLREEISARLRELQRQTAAPEQAAELKAALAVLAARSSEHELGEALRYALIKG